MDINDVVDLDEIDAFTASGMHVVNDRGHTVVSSIGKLAGTITLDRKAQEQRLVEWEEAYEALK